MNEEVPLPPGVLPPCPDGFICRGLSDEQTRLPRKTTYVGSIEVTESMVSTYDESYYVTASPDENVWRLWSDANDDNSEQSICQIYAEGPYLPIPPKVAAIHLLAAAWNSTFHDKPDYEITGEGLLSAPEMVAILAMIFPDPALQAGSEQQADTPSAEDGA